MESWSLDKWTYTKHRKHQDMGQMTLPFLSGITYTLEGQCLCNTVLISRQGGHMYGHSFVAQLSQL